MGSSTEDKRRVFIRVVLVCFLFSAVVSPRATYADGPTDAEGEIVAWGSRKLPNQPLTNLTQIAAGHNHSLGLKTDGSIVAWGRNDYGECDVPSPNTGFTAIAARGSNSLGLRGCAFDLGGDLNNDCKVNMLDFARMGSNWLIHCSTYPYDAACVPK